MNGPKHPRPRQFRKANVNNLNVRNGILAERGGAVGHGIILGELRRTPKSEWMELHDRSSRGEEFKEIHCWILSVCSFFFLTHLFPLGSFHICLIITSTKDFQRPLAFHLSKRFEKEKAVLQVNSKMVIMIFHLHVIFYYPILITNLVFTSK